MAVTLGKVQVLACRGELDWLCKCLTKDQVFWLLNNFGDLTTEEVSERYDLACCMAQRNVKPPPGVPAPAPTTPDCVTKMLDRVCTPEGRKLLGEIDKMLDVLALMPGIDALPITKRTIQVLSIAIDAVEMACDNKAMSPVVAKMLCHAVTQATGQNAGPAEPLMLPLRGLLNTDFFKKSVLECCNSPGLKDIVIPDWIVPK